MDQTKDTQFQSLYEKLTQFPALTGILKTADIEIEDSNHLPSSSFAWPERRLFPIDSKDSATLSRVYLLKTSEEIPSFVKENVNKALKLYKVGIDFDKLEKTATERECSSDHFLLPEKQAFPVTGETDLQKCARDFNYDHKKLTPKDRVKVASSLMKLATTYNQEMPISVLQYAGATSSDLFKLAADLYQRADMCELTKIKECFVKLAEYLDKLPGDECHNLEDLDKVATTLAVLDKAGNLDRYYDGLLKDPALTVFNMTKEAKTFVTLANKQIPEEDLVRVTSETWEDILGEDVLKEILDDAENKESINPENLVNVLNSLPRDYQNLVVNSLGF